MLHYIVVSVFLLSLKSVFLPVWIGIVCGILIVNLQTCRYKKVQACRLFFITAGLYADKQILLHNYLLVCKQADMFAGNKEDFQTG